MAGVRAPVRWSGADRQSVAPICDSNMLMVDPMNTRAAMDDDGEQAQDERVFREPLTLLVAQPRTRTWNMAASGG